VCICLLTLLTSPSTFVPLFSGPEPQSAHLCERRSRRLKVLFAPVTRVPSSPRRHPKDAEIGGHALIMDEQRGAGSGVSSEHGPAIR